MPKSIYKLSAKDLAPDIQLLLLLLKAQRLQEAVVRQVLKGACWWVANAQGRKDACDLWSKKAIELRASQESWDGIGLVHEHMVPRNVIEEEILALSNPTVEQIEKVLSRSRVCVVTADEDKQLREAKLGASLPDGASSSSGGVPRYQVAGIELSEVPFKCSNTTEDIAAPSDS